VALWGSSQFRSPTDRFRAGGREGVETVGVAISVAGFGVERRTRKIVVAGILSRTMDLSYQNSRDCFA